MDDKRHTFQMRITQKDKDNLSKLAQKRGTSVSEAVRDAVKSALKSADDKPEAAEKPPDK